MAKASKEYIQKFNENRRIITYPAPEVKAALKQAVADGHAESVSKLSSDILEQNVDAHIQKLKDGN